ncbi:hypothetical protein F2P81_023690 [Scophthalmus maximus]|uniref:NADH dehydrogenase [ubiquinone] 1 alpha subcomplex assembly factor 4 n=1 Tax=Scophthalmus maximus TaxID=52904 RepID=A0A6A4RUL4_SCOMX|nr:hypothetical protein F2P81_023690 [Scophthalmus maximus]
MSKMGARVTRMFRNFNLENRVFRELSKEKPQAAPRHEAALPPSAGGSEAVEAMNQKNAPLLSLLRSVYVESKDPEAAAAAAAAAAEVSKEVTGDDEAGRRPLRFSLPGEQYGLVELTDVPKGRVGELLFPSATCGVWRTEARRETEAGNVSGHAVRSRTSSATHDTECLLWRMLPCTSTLRRGGVLSADTRVCRLDQLLYFLPTSELPNCS